MMNTISTRIATLILWMIQGLVQGFRSVMVLVGSANFNRDWRRPRPGNGL